MVDPMQGRGVFLRVMGQTSTNDDRTRPGRSGSGADADGADGRRPKAFTPPKGKPTAGRKNRNGSKRVFGPTAQWISVGFLVALVVAVLIAITDGGDFNPFDDEEQLPSPFGAVIADRS